VNDDAINQVLNGPSLNAIDRQFAKFIERLNGTVNPELRLAAAIVSFYSNQGNICVYLPDVAGGEFPPPIENDGKSIRCPPLKEWVKELRASAVVGKPSEFKPLVLDEANRLYLHRYCQYEHQLAGAIQARASLPAKEVDWTLAKDGFARLFPKQVPGETDWQKVAAFAALRNNFCVISGGPGTGKTHTVAKILALLIEQASKTKLHIKLAAPTGKAAARLQESLRNEKAKLDCDATVKSQLPEEVTTLHRLLGVRPDSASARYDAENLLAADVVVVDEASMVGLPLMAKLVAALPISARLILLGDKDQLASVEAGSVLANICDAGESHGVSKEFAKEYVELTGEEISTGSNTQARPLADGIIELQRNYRFGEKSGIHRLSHAVNHSDFAAAMAVLKSTDPTSNDVSSQTLPDFAGLKSALEPVVINNFAPCFQSNEPEGILGLLDKFRILCAVRKGHFGVETINRIVEDILRNGGYIQTDSDWYAGRPVMITRNDYNLRLFNGDIGVALPDVDGALKVYFRDDEQGIRAVSPLRLPEHETVYAMTVHKSQGSEFENVLLILPDRDSPVLTRELVYTGITRSSGTVRLWLREAIFKLAVNRRVERTSGLRDALWNL